MFWAHIPQNDQFNVLQLIETLINIGINAVEESISGDILINLLISKILYWTQQ